MTIDPELLGPLLAGAAVLLLYLAGYIARPARRWMHHPQKVAEFLAAMVVLELTLVGPLEDLGHTSLLWHMVQHFLLLFIAVPLLVDSGCVLICWSAMPRPFARWIAIVLHRVRLPIGPVLLLAWAFAPVLWTWHLPSLYEAVNHNQLLHAVAHLSMVATAFCFWSAALGKTWPRVKPSMRLVLVTASAAAGALFTAVIMFAGQPLYPSEPTLSGQTAAGLVMCIPASLIYLITSVRLVAEMITNAPSMQTAERSRRRGYVQLATYGLSPALAQADATPHDPSDSLIR